MILLFLGIFNEFCVPKRMDRIDHALVWFIKLSLIALFLTLPVAFAQTEPADEFWMSCSDGKADTIKESLKAHPEWANARTKSGESCLHLTGIYGHAKATEILLQQGADPNIRSTWKEGLRMHPLSWNVYGGYIDNIKLLLKFGADVNADFDTMTGSEEDPYQTTVMDIALQLVEQEERFGPLVDLLRKHGGKTMAELRLEKSQEL